MDTGCAVPVTSLCQVHGFTKLLNKLEFGVPVFTGAPETWALTLVPLAILWGYCLLRREIGLYLVLPDFVILAITGALAHTDSAHRFSYHLFSGMVAFLCYRVLVRLER